MHNLPQDFIHWAFEGVKGLKWRGKLLTTRTHVKTHDACRYLSVPVPNRVPFRVSGKTMFCIHCWSVNAIFIFLLIPHSRWRLQHDTYTALSYVIIWSRDFKPKQHVSQFEFITLADLTSVQRYYHIWRPHTHICARRYHLLESSPAQIHTGARKWLLPSDPPTFARGQATFVVIALDHISGLEKSGHVNKPRGHMSSIHPLDKITDPQKTNTEGSQIRAQGAGRRHDRKFNPAALFSQQGSL